MQPNSAEKSSGKKHKKKKSLVPEVKKWVSSEISKLCVSDCDLLEQQILVDVQEDNPLYPLVEMMKTLSKSSLQKQTLISKLESDNLRIKSELVNIETKLPTMINSKVLETKKDIEKEVLIGLRSESQDKLSRVLDILTAFGISCKFNVDQDFELPLLPVNHKSSKSVSPAKSAKGYIKEIENFNVSISSKSSSPDKNAAAQSSIKNIGS